MSAIAEGLGGLACLGGVISFALAGTALQEGVAGILVVVGLMLIAIGMLVTHQATMKAIAKRQLAALEQLLKRP